MNKYLLSIGDGGGGGSDLDAIMESNAISAKDLVFSEDDILKSTINGIPNKEDYELVLTQCPLVVFGHYLTRRVLEEIASLVGIVARLDIKTDSCMRGRFARMVVYVDFEKQLTAQVM
ncbi:hypothetical protein Golob_023052, partial [Gossypium lobatum]|nr:hypothetical protein [Gossypium lobatum]